MYAYVRREAVLSSQIEGTQSSLSDSTNVFLLPEEARTKHLFLNGNGRVGRLLIALILRNEGVLRQPLLYLSLYLKQHRAEYYRLLDAVRRFGDWEAWLDFFLEGTEQTATGAVDSAHRLLAVVDRDAKRIRGLGRRAANALQVFEVLRIRPVTTVGSLAKSAGISFATCARHIEALAELGVVREMTGRSRERVFAYQAYLDILNEGAEPFS